MPWTYSGLIHIQCKTLFHSSSSARPAILYTIPVTRINHDDQDSVIQFTLDKTEVCHVATQTVLIAIFRRSSWRSSCLRRRRWSTSSMCSNRQNHKKLKNGITTKCRRQSRRRKTWIVWRGSWSWQIQMLTLSAGRWYRWWWCWWWWWWWWCWISLNWGDGRIGANNMCSTK